MYFREAEESGKINASPIAGMKQPYNPPRHGRARILTDEELIAVWKAAEAEPYTYGPYQGQRGQSVTRLWRMRLTRLASSSPLTWGLNVSEMR